MSNGVKLDEDFGRFLSLISAEENFGGLCCLKFSQVLILAVLMSGTISASINYEGTGMHFFEWDDGDDYSEVNDGIQGGYPPNPITTGITGDSITRVEFDYRGSYTDNTDEFMIYDSDENQVAYKSGWSSSSGTLTFNDDLPNDLNEVKFGFRPAADPGNPEFIVTSITVEGDGLENYLLNDPATINSVSAHPSKWVNGAEVSLSANISDNDGSVSSASASVWEGESKIYDGLSLSQDADQNWTVSDLFEVDEGDVWYNVSIKATDDSGATTVEWINKSVVGSKLSWSDESDSENGFRIYSNISSANFVEVGSVGASVTTFNYATSALDFGDSRCFQVTAYNQYGESSPAEDCLVP